MNLPEQKARLLDLLQRSLPEDTRPFHRLAEETGSDPETCLRDARSLKEEGIIRDISGIFNAESLGYRTTLAAFRVPEKDLSRAAEAVNSHPGVSHNYRRNHEYNLWFTLAEESDDDLEESLEALAGMAGAGDRLTLRTERLLKIGVHFPAGGKGKGSHFSGERPTDVPLDGKRREAVRLLQIDMPLTERPFDRLAEGSAAIGDGEELVQLMKELKNQRIMRRYAAVLRHRKAGYTHNAMTVWKPADISNEALEPFVREPAVSHAYLRTVYPGRWEYPLFTMIHARSREELEEIINKLAGETGIQDYRALETLEEYRKQRVRYFSDEFAKWKEEHR